MSLYAFAVVLIYWVLHSYDMAFGNKLLPLWAKGAPTLGQKFLIKQARIQKTTRVSQEQKKQFGRIEEGQDFGRWGSWVEEAVVKMADGRRKGKKLGGLSREEGWAGIWNLIRENGQDLREIILVDSGLQCCLDLSLHGIPPTSERPGPICVYQVITDLRPREGVEENFSRLENGVSESMLGVFGAKIRCLHILPLSCSKLS
nr:ammonium transporter 2 [Ipomoea trifida]